MLDLPIIEVHVIDGGITVDRRRRTRLEFLQESFQVGSPERVDSGYL